MKKTVFIAMSGGVDSSVAAALLKKQGYDVVGVHMRCYNVDGCAEQDAEDARRAAQVLGIPFYVFDFEKEYKNKVVEYMVDGYRRGITPNPDVMCNKEIKFGLFLEKALALGADYVATGHYVRLKSAHLPTGTGVVRFQRANAPTPRSDFSPPAKPSKSELRGCRTTDGHISPRYFLLGARDKNKDQSYFLWTLTQEQLKHCLFPIGEYKKPQVRVLAKQFGLLNAGKKDSQGICFLGKVALPDFLKKYIKSRKGDVVLAPGSSLRDAKRRGNLTLEPIKIGIHNGAYLYTIGQRSGLGLGGFGKPLYVVAKDVKKNILIVAEGEDHPALYRKDIKLVKVNLINHLTNNQVILYARVRYRQPLTKAKLYKLQATSYKLVFDKPQKFVATGQSAVWYDRKGLMLGGGIIA